MPPPDGPRGLATSGAGSDALLVKHGGDVGAQRAEVSVAALRGREVVPDEAQQQCQRVGRARGRAWRAGRVGQTPGQPSRRLFPQTLRQQQHTGQGSSDHALGGGD